MTVKMFRDWIPSMKRFATDHRSCCGSPVGHALRLICRVTLVLALAFPVALTGAETRRARDSGPATGETTDPVELEFKSIMREDDAAQDDVDAMIKEVQALEGRDPKAYELKSATLNSRIDQRYAIVRKRYEDFLRRHPRHARAELAYGSFLYDIQEEEEGVRHMERARDLDPKNPAVWNNLANHHGHHGDVKVAFEYYAKAIELDPEQPVYLQNLATTVYLFRTDGKEYYGLSEEELFNKSLDLYRRAIRLDPKSFTLAADYAQTYYGIRPLRTEDALKAWRHALEVAGDSIERQGVQLHLARVQMMSGRFAAAREHLQLVTDDLYRVLKERLQRSLEHREAQAAGSGRDPSSPTPEKKDVEPSAVP